MSVSLSPLLAYLSVYVLLSFCLFASAIMNVHMVPEGEVKPIRNNGYVCEIYN